MKRILIIILLLFIGINAYSYDWPVKVFTKQHGINATLGEYRPGHFHNGVDINAADSTPVYSVVTDTVWRYDDPYGHHENDGILTKDSVYWYIHLDARVLDTTYINAYTDSIGIVYDSCGHVHFREGLNGAHPIINPLRNTAFTPYVDSTNPHIDSIIYYLQCSGDTLLHKDSLNRKVDIVSIAGDARTNTTGHSAGGNVSVYKIGYLVRNMKDTLVKPYWEKVKFDSIPSNSYFGLVYADSSLITHFRYYVTNDVFNSNTNLKNMYWNTKQS